MKFNLFRKMRENRAENDERITSERMQASLSTLRMMQFIIIFLQLTDQIFMLWLPENRFFEIPLLLYMLMILPFIINPLYAIGKGYIGAIKEDVFFFIIGMIEFGYFIYALSTYFGATNVPKLIGLFFAGMAAFYLISVVLYNITARVGTTSRSNDNDDD